MSQEKTGPLAGIRVIDMSTVVLGPYAGQIMGDLGAEVIRVESPQSDMTRWAGNSPHPGFGTIFMTCNRNKRSLCLDLRKDSAKAAFRELIKTADVFLHNVRRAGIARLGFDYEDVKAIKPDIVYVHAVGYGSEGPYAGQPAYDDLVQAAGGSAGLNAFIDPEAHPEFMPTLAADKTSGLHAAYATMAALFHRERTGEGQFVEVPMLESFASFLMIEHLNGHVYDPPTGDYGYHNIINFKRRPYPTSDGHLCIMPYQVEQWRRILKLGGLDIADDDPRFIDMNALRSSINELYDLLRTITPAKTSDEWADIFVEMDVPFAHINSPVNIMEEPHLKDVGLFQRREHPHEGGYMAMRHPVKFEATPAGIYRDPPALGEHNREVLAEAGLSDDTINALESEGALFSMVPPKAD
ncbi:MAG: CaiB/BaiF CoA transferase family protein [Alphaproteobacteria bacterium]